MKIEDLIMEKVDELEETKLRSQQKILEQMVMESYKEWEYLDLCIKHHREPVDILYQEGIGKALSTVKRKSGNLFMRLRSLSKRNITVIKTLLGHVKDVMQGMSGKFRKSGAKKSASAIAHEALRKKLDPNKKLAESEARVKLPFKGKETQSEIELINSAYLIEEFNDDDSFMIDLMGVNYVKDDKGKAHAIADKGEGVKATASLFVYTNALIFFVKNPSEMDEFVELIVQGFKFVNNNGDLDPMDYHKKVRTLMKKADAKTNALRDLSHTKMTMKELTAFQSRVNKLEEMLDFTQNGNNNLDDVDSRVIDSLNNLVSITEHIQFGLTSLTNAMQNVHLIDLKYMNSIDDRDVLSKFVYECVQNGIPPKYIAYNTWLIANEQIRGSAATYKPVAGQTRCIFFPIDNKKEILKIAISGIGITSNKNEIRFAEFLKRSKEQEMIDISAMITNSYYEDAIVAMERVVDRVGKHPDLLILNEIKQKYADFTKRHPELRLVISDFNDGNVMWSSDKNRWVCIDYGLGKRNSATQEKLDKQSKKSEKKASKLDENLESRDVVTNKKKNDDDNEKKVGQ